MLDFLHDRPITLSRIPHLSETHAVSLFTSSLAFEVSLFFVAFPKKKGRAFPLILLPLDASSSSETEHLK